MPWGLPGPFTSGQLVTAAMMNQIRDSLLTLEQIASVQFTSNVSITTTSEGAANTVVSSGTISYNAEPILIEFYSPRIVPGVAALRGSLRRQHEPGPGRQS